MLTPTREDLGQLVWYWPNNVDSRPFLNEPNGSELVSFAIEENGGTGYLKNHTCVALSLAYRTREEAKHVRATELVTKMNLLRQHAIELLMADIPAAVEIEATEDAVTLKAAA